MQDTSNVPATQTQNEKDIPVLQEKPAYEICKRIFDIIVSGCAMLLLSPVYLLTAIAIKCQDGGKVLYVSTRLTKNNREFRMYKFRSMVPNAEEGLCTPDLSANNPDAYRKEHLCTKEVSKAAKVNMVEHICDMKKLRN